MTPVPFHFDIAAKDLRVFLGSTEADLMELAWRHPSLTVKSAIVHLNRDKPPAYTTVMTILNHLVKKGLLRRIKDGRNFIYEATVDREAFIADRINRIQTCLQKNFPIAFEASRYQSGAGGRR